MFKRQKGLFKRFSILLLVVAVLFSFQVPVFAATVDSMELKNFYVDVWPEYDDPRVLVIYKGTFVNNTGKTVKAGEKVSFNIPSGAEIGMACETDANYGAHACQPYETEDVKGPDGKVDYVVLSWKTTKDVEPGQEYPVFLEFYYNPIEGQVDKVINYEFKPSAKIATLNLLIQQPLKATNFKLEPAAPTSGKSGDFTNYYYSYSNVKQDDKFDIKISYTKNDSNPSVQKTENGGAGTTGGGESKLGTAAWTQPGVIASGLFFVLLLGFFIYYALNNSNKPNKRVQRIKNKQGKKSVKADENYMTSSKGQNGKLTQEKKKIRQMLLNGEISEETYRELIDDLSM